MRRLLGFALAFILACIIGASCLRQAQAGPSWHGPALDTLGIHLRACSYVEGPAEIPAQLWPSAYQVVDQHPDLLWLSYVVLDPVPYSMPRDLVPVLYGQSFRVPAALCFAIGGPPQLQPLPFYAICSPSLLWRKRLPCVKDIASVLFIGFPRGAWNADSATALSLESPQRTP